MFAPTDRTRTKPGMIDCLARRLQKWTLRLEDGNTSRVKWIGGNLGEYRIDWGPGYRIYLTKESDTLTILFGGGIKDTQRRDIARAKEPFIEYKSQKKGN